MDHGDSRLRPSQRTDIEVAQRISSDGAYDPFIEGQGSAAHSATSQPYGATESHQFEQNESEVWWHHQLQRHYDDKGRWWTTARKSDIKRWALTLITGFWCGVMALVVAFYTKVLTKYKFQTFHHLVAKERSEELPFGSACAFLFIVNLVFGFVAWLTVSFEPLAAGSGIPEVKCFLNGVDIPRLVRIKTLVCKAVGIIFAVSAGLPVGKEGPMVHMGAIVAGVVSQGKSFCGVDWSISKVHDFRNDAEKRDFVACGAAAGVAAAFGAPIGGVLFSLEEGSSFWSTKLTWRAFFCAMVTVFTLFVANTAHSMFGRSENRAMFSFGNFYSLQGEQSNFSVWELALFMVIGVMGGLIGAYFNFFVSMIAKWRQVHVRGKLVRLLEVLLIVSVMSGIALASPIMWGRCTPLPVVSDAWSDQERRLAADLVPLYCDARSEYNELASLYLADGDVVIRQLFHFREGGDHYGPTFSSQSLFLFFLPYLIMACVTYGTAVPAGMFVPSLTSGAAFGRLVGHLLHMVDNTRGTFADSGTYSLIGAIAITGGISRITISLTVMVLEATGDMQYVLPLMLTVLTACWVGNLFTEGIYDLTIHLKRLGYLDEEASVTRLVRLHDVTVADIMAARPYYLLPIMRVGEYCDILAKAKHNCYPVVESDTSNVLVGAILRKTICTLLKHRAFLCHSGSSTPTTVEGVTATHHAPLVDWATMEGVYPEYPDLDELNLSDEDRNCWLDLRPYLDRAPFTMNEHASVQRCYRVFRTLGLRHLLVVNSRNQVLGIVTRQDLVGSTTEQAGAESDKSGRSRRKKVVQRRRRSASDTVGQAVEMVDL